tara:strand:+ start:147 stop:1037 length:891 start_codon:yes stop_codon:yes gene_type:complete
LIKILKIQSNSDIRLDKYLKIKYTSLTQSFIEKNIRKKNILINDTKTLSKYKVKKNDILKILNFNEEIYRNKIIFKRKINISKDLIKQFKKSIIFQNNDFLVINKWHSIATQGGSNIVVSIDDIINIISTEYKLVHRLDKDTSGLLIISKNKNSAKVFGNLFKLGLIDKTYLAICEGSPKLKESILYLDIKNKFKKIEKTQTFYKLLKAKFGISLIEFKPKTGKTHQLRIVSKNLSCPIVGDIKYNNHTKFKKEILKLNAHKLKFSFNNKDYNFISELPNDFKNFLAIKKINYPSR